MTQQEHIQMIITKYDLLFESRLTKVETTLTNLDKHIIEIKSDIRWMFGIMLGFSGVLLGLMAKGFHWVQ
jgi:hypothetical protein